MMSNHWEKFKMLEMVMAEAEKQMLTQLKQKTGDPSISFRRVLRERDNNYKWPRPIGFSIIINSEKLFRVRFRYKNGKTNKEALSVEACVNHPYGRSPSMEERSGLLRMLGEKYGLEKSSA